MRKKAAPEVVQSAKAGRPPREVAISPRVRRRARTARARMKKDTMLLQAGKLTRATWGAASPRIKKGKTAP
ncbi:MAG TPA: hypothetical protein VNO23_01990 [Candidatus Binatia bacterium]|jgi:hypothetical protein|nr:hypothetical protein [Candidatus Binatia bacterium]